MISFLVRKTFTFSTFQLIFTTIHRLCRYHFHFDHNRFQTDSLIFFTYSSLLFCKRFPFLNFVTLRICVVVSLPKFTRSTENSGEKLKMDSVKRVFRKHLKHLKVETETFSVETFSVETFSVETFKRVFRKVITNLSFL